MTINNIFNTLEKLGLTSVSTRELFSLGTRDNPKLKVWKDSISGVIYISDFYVGEKVYQSGSYRNQKIVDLSTGIPDVERLRDLNRRVKAFSNFFTG